MNIIISRWPISLIRFDKRKVKAFTMIELLVVIAIIALLLGILIPSLRMAKSKAKRLDCAARLRSIGQAIQTYAFSSGERIFPRYSNKDGEASYDRDETITSWEAYVAASTFYRQKNNQIRPVQLGHLYTEGLIDTPESFYCPLGVKTVTADNYMFQPSHYIQNSDLSPHNQLPGNAVWGLNKDDPDKIRTSFQYWSWFKIRLSDVSQKAIVFDRVFKWKDIAHLRHANQPEGLNALFGDGHVNFCMNADLFDRSLWGVDKNGQLVGENPGDCLANFEEIIRRLRP